MITKMGNYNVELIRCKHGRIFLTKWEKEKERTLGLSINKIKKKN